MKYVFDKYKCSNCRIMSSPSSFTSAMAEEFKPFCASFAVSIVANRTFFVPKYMNRDLMQNEIVAILSQWLATEGLRVIGSFTQFLSEVVREELQQPIARVLCPFHDRFRGQDNGLFDITMTDTYKALHYDLFEFLLEFIRIYGASYYLKDLTRSN